MANIKSAKKRILVNKRQAEVNGARRSRMRTFVKKVDAAIEAKDKKAADAAFQQAQPEIMRSVAKGLLHKNTASRKLSRMSARIKALSKSGK